MTKTFFSLFLLMSCAFGQCYKVRDKAKYEDGDWVNLGESRQVVAKFNKDMRQVASAATYLNEKIKEGDPNKIYRFRNELIRALNEVKAGKRSAEIWLPLLKCEAGELLRANKIDESKYDSVMALVKEMELITNTTFAVIEKKIADTAEKKD